jgi:hypothetical protein
MNQCFGAVENMFQAKFPPPNLTSLKRKSLSDLADHPAKRQAIVAPAEPLATSARVIQPRPPTNGYSQVAPVSVNSPGLTPSGKKRGRPSKADKEAQARASYSRSLEFAPITPAPLAQSALQPPRDFASPPLYDVAGNAGDQKARRRGRPAAVDSAQGQPAGSSFMIASPAAADMQRGGHDSTTEHAERGTLSPRDRGSIPSDSRSPTLLPHIQQREQPQMLSPLPPRTQPQLHAPQQPPRPQLYEPYRVTDPIFPDRDRSRGVPDRAQQDSAPTPPIANRG